MQPIRIRVDAVRRDALFMGAAWTLILTVPHFLFKSAATWPLSVVSLAAAGVGWAAIALYAQRRQRLASEQVLAKAGDASRAAIDGVTQVLIEEAQGACTELQRVDDLLGHAIEQLMAAFRSVSEQACAYQRDLAQAADAAQGWPAAEQLRIAAERVESDVNGVITALQFRDVVGQKLGHVRVELVALEQTVRGIREACARCVEAEIPSRVDGLLMQWRKARGASPVRQQRMHAGEVELF